MGQFEELSFLFDGKDEQEEFVPEKDEEAALSLFEIGMQKLNNLDHNTQLDAINAYTQMRCLYSLE